MAPITMEPFVFVADSTRIGKPLIPEHEERDLVP